MVVLNKLMSIVQDDFMRAQFNDNYRINWDIVKRVNLYAVKEKIEKILDEDIND